MYTPMLILGLGAWAVFLRRHRAEAWLMAGLWLTLLAFYSPYNFWTGGFNWGPRFLLPVLPFGFLPLGALLEESRSRLASLIFALLFAVGFLIQTPAILVDHSRYLYQRFARHNGLHASLTPVAGSSGADAGICATGDLAGSGRQPTVPGARPGGIWRAQRSGSIAGRVSASQHGGFLVAACPSPESIRPIAVGCHLAVSDTRCGERHPSSARRSETQAV